MRRFHQVDLFGNDSDDSDDSSFNSEDASASDDDSSSSFPFPRAPVVNLAAAPVLAVADDDDDDVQILTAEEAAASVAAAQQSERVRSRKRPRVETKAEPTECSVCCEDCTVVGRHRLVALRCGHLFGKKCIEHWLSEKRTCPNCNQVTRPADIVPLFSDHVAVVDNSGLEDMTSKFEEERKKTAEEIKKRQEIEKEMEKMKKIVEVQLKDAEKLRAEVLKWKNAATLLRSKLQLEQNVRATHSSATHDLATRQGATTGSSASQSTTSGWLAQVLHSPEPQGQPVAIISQSQSSLDPGSSGIIDAEMKKYKLVIDYPLIGARVFGIARSCSFMCVGEQFGTGMHGILKLDTQASVPVSSRVGTAHTSAVRDLCINSKEDLAITVAFDGKLAVTNLKTLGVVMKISLPAGRRQGWSCALSEDDPFAMYCGFQDGSVAKYDMRKPAPGEQGIVKLFSLPERQPVHSTKLFRSHDGLRAEGLAAATFRGLSVWKNVEHATPGGNHHLGSSSMAPPPDAQVSSVPPCFSLSSSQLCSNNVLVSSRSQDSTPTMHSVFDLQTLATGQLVPKSELVGHKAPSVLSRSAIWNEADGSPVAASWSHDIGRVTVWDIAMNRELCGINVSPSASSTAMPVVDIQHAVKDGRWSSQTALLGTMMAQQLCVYRASPL